MAQVYFPAVLEKSSAGFGVWFPHFAGCTSAGETHGEAIRNAEEALSFHLEGMAEDGEVIPDSTYEWPDGFDPPTATMVVLIRTEGPGKVVRANVTFEEGLLRRIDRAAEDAHTTRSGWLAELARERLRSATTRSATAEHALEFDFSSVEDSVVDSGQHELEAVLVALQAQHSLASALNAIIGSTSDHGARAAPQKSIYDLSGSLTAAHLVPTRPVSSWFGGGYASPPDRAEKPKVAGYYTDIPAAGLVGHPKK